MSSATNTKVYPRVGGGTVVGRRGPGERDGLSPRGRGNPLWPLVCHRYGLSPRGRGNLWAAEAAQDAILNGLSPRGRGNRCARVGGCHQYGSIPAWAGEPIRCSGCGPIRRSIPAWAGEPTGIPHTPARVYPRVGGGTDGESFLNHNSMGLSPRGRGNHGQQREVKVYRGLSPRGRGNRGTSVIRFRNLWSIPAWAGEPGKSPFQFASIRSIPAWAGEPCDSPLGYSRDQVYPRVGGGTPMPGWCRWRKGVYPRVGGGTPTWATTVKQGLSPRGRGNQLPCAWSVRWGLSPRGRGNPFGLLTRTVYPRVGGGTSAIQRRLTGLSPCPLEGLSPRGRGNRRGSPVECRWLIGLSPRGRGNPLIAFPTAIPWVYPRVGGGTPISPIPTRLEYRRSQL